jgi:hypothetical protein
MFNLWIYMLVKDPEEEKHPDDFIDPPGNVLLFVMRKKEINLEFILTYKEFQPYIDGFRPE